MLDFQLNEEERAELRTIVDKIDREISNLPKHGPAEAYWTAADELLTAWAGLHELLMDTDGLGLPECPICRHSGRRDAPRCGYCWREIPALGFSNRALRA